MTENYHAFFFSVKKKTRTKEEENTGALAHIEYTHLLYDTHVMCVAVTLTVIIIICSEFVYSCHLQTC